MYLSFSVEWWRFYNFNICIRQVQDKTLISGFLMSRFCVYPGYNFSPFQIPAKTVKRCSIKILDPRFTPLVDFLKILPLWTPRPYKESMCQIWSFGHLVKCTSSISQSVSITQNRFTNTALMGRGFFWNAVAYDVWFYPKAT